VAATIDGERLFGGAAPPLELAMLELEEEEREEAADGTRRRVFSFLRMSPGLLGALGGDWGATMTVRGIVFVIVSERVGRGTLVRLCCDCKGSLACAFGSASEVSSRMQVSVLSALPVLSLLSRSHSLRNSRLGSGGVGILGGNVKGGLTFLSMMMLSRESDGWTGGT
jgi:hypothetical protein